MARHRKQADHRAETRGKGLSGLPHIVADSAAYLSLTTFERAVFGEILRRFNGYNNGKIGITYEQIGDRLKGRNRSRPNNGRIARSMARLIDHGLIAEPTPESWLQRRAREYRLTFISSGKAPPYRPATNEYLQWKPPTEKNDGNAVSPRNTQSGDARSRRGFSARAAGSPDKSVNRGFATDHSPRPGDAGSLLIDQPYGGGAHTDTCNLIPFPGRQTCERCGAPFEPGSRGKPRRFCSERCRKRAESRRRLERQRGRHSA